MKPVKINKRQNHFLNIFKIKARKTKHTKQKKASKRKYYLLVVNQQVKYALSDQGLTGYCYCIQHGPDCLLKFMGIFLIIFIFLYFLFLLTTN